MNTLLAEKKSNSCNESNIGRFYICHDTIDLRQKYWEIKLCKCMQELMD